MAGKAYFSAAAKTWVGGHGFEPVLAAKSFARRSAYNFCRFALVQNDE